MSRKAAVRVRALALAVAVLTATAPAGAVFTFTSLGWSRSVTMRVGSTNSTVQRVTFNVANAAIAPNGGTQITGVPGNGAPATTQPNGIDIVVNTTSTLGILQTDTMTLSVNSATALSCVAGSGCGSTTIPFNTIGWTSYDTDDSGQDIQSGTFSGSATQQIASYTTYVGLLGGRSVNMRNVLVFHYANATLFPAGRYQGRVIYTATLL